MYKLSLPASQQGHASATGGVNLVYIRDILGHVSIQTTDIYARADSQAKREALEKAYADLTPNRNSDKS